MSIALFPGSFDPVTLGHLDVIARARRLFDELVVAVMHNPDKRGAIDVYTRVELMRKACAAFPNVRVIAHDGLMVDCAREAGANVVVRGLRPIGDFDGEYQMAQINRLIGGVETLLMPTSPGMANISSSIVRQVAAFGGELGGLVPPELVEDIQAALARGMGGARG